MAPRMSVASLPDRLPRALPQTQSARWWFALKPASWPKLLVPAFFGQTLGAATGRTAWSWAAAATGLLFTLCLLAFIVLLNDWGDQRVDTIKRQMFPRGCSPKTIPDGVLPARQLLIVGLLAGLLGLLVSVLGGLWLRLPFLGWLGAICLAVFVAYTLPPLKLNYRGGGELLEALGVGALLPGLNAQLQSRSLSLDHAALGVLPGAVLLALSSALVSGLSDEESDRVGGKHTVTTWIGNGRTRRAAELCLGLGVIAWLVAAALWPRVIVWWAVVPAVAVVVGHGRRVVRMSPRAVTNAFAAQGAYKLELHRALWRGHLLLGLLLAMAAWIEG